MRLQNYSINPPRLRGIKFCFLTMVLLAGFSWGLWGQGALECGTYEKKRRITQSQ